MWKKIVKTFKNFKNIDLSLKNVCLQTLKSFKKVRNLKKNLKIFNESLRSLFKSFAEVSKILSSMEKWEILHNFDCFNKVFFLTFQRESCFQSLFKSQLMWPNSWTNPTLEHLLFFEFCCLFFWLLIFFFTFRFKFGFSLI